MSLGGWLVGWFMAERWEIRCWTQQRSCRKVPMCFRLVPSNLTLDDPEGTKVNVKILWFEISRKRQQIQGWAPREHLYVEVSRAFDWHHQIWPSVTLRGHNEGHTCEICQEQQELRCWTQRRLYRAHGLHFEWPWEIKGQVHNPFIQNILKTVTYTRLDPRSTYM